MRGKKDEGEEEINPKEMRREIRKRRGQKSEGEEERNPKQRREGAEEQDRRPNARAGPSPDASRSNSLMK